MISPAKPLPSAFATLWALDPEVVYLNHGSFGACPKWILERQQEYRMQLEAGPIQFLIRELEQLHQAARETLADFVDADPADLVLVRNATEAVNIVFRSLRFNPGDEILITSHIYPACRRILEFVCESTGAVLKEVDIPFPLSDSGVVIQAMTDAVSPETRISLIDHVTSSTALILPVEEIVRELDRRGVDVMIDGAHAMGSIPLDLSGANAAYYTANCHKWLCSPKSSAILHVRKDKQRGIIPMVISHAGHSAEPFAERFFWPATFDPSAALCAADMVGYMGSLLPGGWPELMQRNRKLCLDAREMLCHAWDIEKPCPDRMIASMATLLLPAPAEIKAVDYKSCDPLQEKLRREYGLEIPFWYCGEPPGRITRISVQLYNSMEQFDYLREALDRLLP